MPSAWEPQQIDIVMGLPHQGSVTMEWVLGFLELQRPPMVYYSFQRGMPIDVARNLVCDKAIELKAKGVFFLDSDVIVPKDGLIRLLEHSLPIVSGMYYKKQATEGIYVPTMWAKAEKPSGAGKFTPIIDVPKGNFVDCEVIGMGACWISRRVLEEWIRCEECGETMTWKDETQDRLYFCASCETEPHRVFWFYFSKGRTPGPADGMSEDFFFCQEAKRRGFKIIVDTAVACRHIGYFAVEDGQVRDLNV